MVNTDNQNIMLVNNQLNILNYFITHINKH